MTRPRSPLLPTLPGRLDVPRCLVAVNWISRRLKLEELTNGRVLVRGQGAAANWFVQGKPFFSQPVIDTIKDTGLNGVGANTDASRERVVKEWRSFESEWRILQTVGNHRTSEPDLRDLITRTNSWIDSRLHRIERRRLQAYLRQVSHRRDSPDQEGKRPANLRIPRNVYDQLISGVPRYKRTEYISRLLEWAIASPEARSWAIAAAGISQNEQRADP